MGVGRPVSSSLSLVNALLLRTHKQSLLFLSFVRSPILPSLVPTLDDATSAITAPYSRVNIQYLHSDHRHSISPFSWNTHKRNESSFRARFRDTGQLLPNRRHVPAVGPSERVYVGQKDNRGPMPGAFDSRRIKQQTNGRPAGVGRPLEHGEKEASFK